MSFKTITVMLLLSCLGATSTALGGKKEPPQNAPEIFSITDVHWLWDGTSTTIHICTPHDLSVGLLSLVFNDGSGTIQNVEGFVDTTTVTCANFQKPGTYKLNENPARYELNVRETGTPDAFFRGVTTFAITVRTTLLTCGLVPVTKITWTGDETLPGNFACIDDPSDILVKVCYHEEDLTGKEFCFSVNDGGADVNVCLNGRPIDIPALSDGVVSVNYFFYGGDGVTNAAAEATLSLLMETTDQTKLRAIVRPAGDPPGVANIHDCSITECLIPSYPRTVATYEVCVEAMDDTLVTLRTATTTFTDMRLNAFDGGSTTGVLVELVFGNELADMKYRANLYQEPPPTQITLLSTVDLDCTSVQPGNACFGFLDGSAGAATVYVSVSDRDDKNTIIVPYNIALVQGLSHV